MPAPETFVEKELSLELTESGGEVRLVWRGKSNDREPGHFLMPILNGALERSQAGLKRLALDFTGLEYMNSSTFAPIVKMLDEATRAGGQVQLEFSQDRRWQSLSFSALKAFETSDGRIKLLGR
ncbi:MAG: hypothetical protein ACYC8T_15340 [Myxococcaceae bacterium]